MAYPIKYIENNLVFNHDGECFAYYELLPYKSFSLCKKHWCMAFRRTKFLYFWKNPTNRRQAYFRQ